MSGLYCHVNSCVGNMVHEKTTEALNDYFFKDTDFLMMETMTD